MNRLNILIQISDNHSPQRMNPTADPLTFHLGYKYVVLSENVSTTK